MKKEEVFKFLEDNGIKYEVHFHEPTVSVEDSLRIIHISNCMGCKSLFVKDKKSERYFMCVLPSEKRAEMRLLAHYVGADKFEFAAPEKMSEYLDVVRGNVSPFCFLYEGSKRVGLLIDSELKSAPRVRFHPCENTATVVLETEEFFRCLHILGKTSIFV